MAYFDNAATTFPKPEKVYSFINEYYRVNGASAGRGRYESAMSASRLFDDTRSRIQDLLYCPAKQVVFTPTATIALNIIIQGLINKDIKNVYITPFEHNAITRTLHHFETHNRIRIHQLKVNRELRYDFDAIKRQFEQHKPDLLIMSHASNVCGLIAPIEELSIIAKEYGAIVVVDMAQTAGLVPCNIGLETIDFAVFAGHKTLYGPTGISGFVMKPDIDLEPILFGGTGFDSANQDMPLSLPERFEMGTMNSLGIAGLNASLQWIKEIGIDTIRKTEEKNRQKLLDIFSLFDFIKPVGNILGNDYVGVVSVLVEGISSDSCGSIFDQLGISVRSGLQCAPLAHRFLGTFPSGTVRFSVSYFTSEKDFQELEKALAYIEDNL